MYNTLSESSGSLLFESTKRSNMKEYDQNQFVKDCQLFNVLANKITIPSKQDLVNQLKLIQEELTETIDALEANDSVKVLDGYVDVGVTWAGLGQMLDILGMDTLGAMKATAENNLTKFIKETDSEAIISTLDLYASKNIDLVVERNLDHGTIVFKDMNDKVRKPAGYVSNNLSDFVPEGLEIE